MGSIVVQEFITLDGVIQAPGGSTEDDQHGFPYGGWQMDYDRDHGRDEDENVVVEWEKSTAALLLGRRTYDIWAQAWGVWPEDAPGLQGEFTRRYNRVPKYVASRSPRELGWRNSHQLAADLPAAVRAIRDETDGEVRVWGSADLIQTLATEDLVDEYRLMVYPILLGTGKKLFRDGIAHATLQLTGNRVLASGVVITTYRRR